MNVPASDSDPQKSAEFSSAQLMALVSRFQTLLEQERTRVARELHDDLTQKMTVLSLELALIDGSLVTSAELLRAPLREKVKELSQLVSTMIQSLRRINSELRPKVLDEFGLVAALEWESEEFQRRTGIRCRLKVQPEEINLPPHLTTELYRIFQQIMSNVAEHARARRVQIEATQEKGWVYLRIADDGRGITPDQLASAQSLGLLELRHRASAIAGKLTIERLDGLGTVVAVSVPTHAPSPGELRGSSPL